MKTILIATDFSAAANNAADYAADMAMAVNADLFLLHVFHLPVIYMEVPVAMNETEILDAEKAMAQLKERLASRTRGKLHIETEISTGLFFSGLETLCERIKPYAVVIGSQGTTAAERLFFGGHAVYAMKHLMWPLITVSPQVKFSSIKKIGLACDFHEAIDAIPVSEIKMLVKDFDAELHIINTGKKQVFDADIVFESVELKELLADLKHQVYFITNENTDQGILDFVENNHIDLLIVLPKRHALLDKIIHRSHTKQLVLHSHVPVIALHM